MPDHCTYQYTQDGCSYSCSRPEHAGGFCILHSDRADKPADKFLAALKEELDGDEANCLNLRGVRFWAIGDLFEDRQFNRETVFDGSQFKCKTIFKRIRFLKKCSFRNVEFTSVGFDECEFGGAATFGPRTKSARWSCRATVFRQGAKFQQTFGSDGASFIDVTFNGRTSFARATFHGPIHFSGNVTPVVFRGLATFIGATFVDSISFKNVHFELGVSFKVKQMSIPPVFENVRFMGKTLFVPLVFGSQTVTFHRCHLSGVRLLSLPVLYCGLELNSCTWPRRESGRAYVADESENKKSQDLFCLYRKLHQYYYERSDFGLASDFYVGFMTLKRRVQSEKCTSKVVNLFYWALSNYGESILRPALGLIFILFYVPLILLELGQHGYPADMGYWDLFGLNLSWVTFFRTDPLRPPLSTSSHYILMAETFLVWLLLGFTALGIRRAHAPKKPV